MKRLGSFAKKEARASSTAVLMLVAFVVGAVVAASLVVNLQVMSTVPGPPPAQCVGGSVLPPHHDQAAMASPATGSGGGGGVLQGLRVLVAIAAFDFSQIPHLEEVVDGYHDLCTAGATVDVVIHATVAYPVAVLDLWNTRLTCERFHLTIALQNRSLRLHLVDRHRRLFYDNLDRYDLFIYTEDDIRVTPSVVAAYWTETQRVARIVAADHDPGTTTTTTTTRRYQPSDFNVGVVRYEYNYPPNVVMDDRTRHATANVTRVYWEHSGCDRPVVPHCAAPLDRAGGDRPMPDLPAALQRRYITMRNHHQGMYLATRALLAAWRDRPRCRFHEVRDRPGRGGQPTEGTQRVWMSSQMLYGGRHCAVQQLLPRDAFGSLTVLHLPNKNYRRVGRYRNRRFADGTEVFEPLSDKLLTAMELHLGLLRGLPPKEPQIPYKGIEMIDEVDKPADRTPLLERRMKEYADYVKRGGVLSEDDATRSSLFDTE